MTKVNAQAQAPVEEQQVKAKSNYQVVEETFDELEFEKSESSNYDDVYFVKPKTKDAAYLNSPNASLTGFPFSATSIFTKSC